MQQISRLATHLLRLTIYDRLVARQTGWAEGGSRAREAAATRKRTVIKRRKNDGLLSKALCLLCEGGTQTFRETRKLQVAFAAEFGCMTTFCAMSGQNRGHGLLLRVSGQKRAVTPPCPQPPPGEMWVQTGEGTGEGTGAGGSHTCLGCFTPGPGAVRESSPPGLYHGCSGLTCSLALRPHASGRILCVCPAATSVAITIGAANVLGVTFLASLEGLVIWNLKGIVRERTGS